VGDIDEENGVKMEKADGESTTIGTKRTMKTNSYFHIGLFETSFKILPDEPLVMMFL